MSKPVRDDYGFRELSRMAGREVDELRLYLLRFAPEDTVDRFLGKRKPLCGVIIFPDHQAEIDTHSLPSILEDAAGDFRRANESPSPRSELDKIEAIHGLLERAAFLVDSLDYGCMEITDAFASRHGFDYVAQMGERGKPPLWSRDLRTLVEATEAAARNVKSEIQSGSHSSRLRMQALCGLFGSLCGSAQLYFPNLKLSYVRRSRFYTIADLVQRIAARGFSDGWPARDDIYKPLKQAVSGHHAYGDPFAGGDASRP